jgi:hypothetical protein
MQKRIWKRIALGVLSVLGVLIIVLCVHIYMVTRPKPMDANTRAMARIDIKQAITQTDADAITAWLYKQKGVDHVLVNPESDIAVFTFFPLKTTASQVVGDFRAQMPYKAERYVPSAEEMKTGCPVASTSATYRVYSFFKHIF